LYREVRAYAIPGQKHHSCPLNSLCFHFAFYLGGSEEIMLDLGIREAIKTARKQAARLKAQEQSSGSTDNDQKKSKL
jgi:hypothetical protein